MMTLTQANQIWTDCYASANYELWDKYTDSQREEAILVRNQAIGGNYGTWDISDRH